MYGKGHYSELDPAEYKCLVDFMALVMVREDREYLRMKAMFGKR